MNKIEVLQLLVALLATPVEDLRSCHSVGESMVRNDVVELLAFPLLNLVHESAHLVLQTLGVGSILLLIHGMPPVRRVWADRLADGDVVWNLEDLEGGHIVGL